MSYFDHDRLDRLTKKTTIAGAVYYAYDVSGLRTSLKDPDLMENRYVYDDAGRLSKVELAASQTAYYTYDAAGLIVRRDMPENVIIAYMAYDTAGRLAALNQLRNGTSMQERSYLRNPLGATTRETIVAVGSTGYNYYEYDSLDRLTREIQTSNFGLTLDNYYAWDAASNRTKKGSTVSTGFLYSYAYDARNLLSTETPAGGSATAFDHDAAQRLTRQRNSAEATYFAFNQRDQVVRLQNVKAVSPDPIQYFSYSGAGERVRIADGDGEAYWSFDGSKLLREKASGGGIVARYRHNFLPGSISDYESEVCPKDRTALSMGGSFGGRSAAAGSLLQAYYTPDPEVSLGKQLGSPRYDEFGSIVSFVSAGGTLDSYTYDRFGTTTATRGKQRLRLALSAPFVAVGTAQGVYLTKSSLWLPAMGCVLSVTDGQVAPETPPNVNDCPCTAGAPTSHMRGQTIESLEGPFLPQKPFAAMKAQMLGREKSYWKASGALSRATQTGPFSEQAGRRSAFGHLFFVEIPIHDPGKKCLLSVQESARISIRRGRVVDLDLREPKGPKWFSGAEDEKKEPSPFDEFNSDQEMFEQARAKYTTPPADFDEAFLIGDAPGSGRFGLEAGAVMTFEIMQRYTVWSGSTPILTGLLAFHQVFDARQSPPSHTSGPVGSSFGVPGKRFRPTLPSPGGLGTPFDRFSGI